MTTYVLPCRLTRSATVREPWLALTARRPRPVHSVARSVTSCPSSAHGLIFRAAARAGGAAGYPVGRLAAGWLLASGLPLLPLPLGIGPALSLELPPDVPVPLPAVPVVLPAGLVAPPLMPPLAGTMMSRLRSRVWP